MLRKFKIRVDGTEYMVEMEEIGGTSPQIPVSQPTAVDIPVAHPQPVVEDVPTPPVASAPVKPGEGALDSPMPGTILKILVNEGESVSENQPLLILEAMKMENEVVAKHEGVVKGIHVTQGQVVNAGDSLITVE